MRLDHFPYQAPSIAFTSEVFHPLVAPLTTAAPSSIVASATDDEYLPPGGFSLKDGFPEWFANSEYKPQGSKDLLGNVSWRLDGSHQSSLKPGPVTEFKRLGSGNESQEPSSTQMINEHGTKSLENHPCMFPNMVKVLSYMKRAFEDESLLDVLSSAATENSSAWHAWKAYRKLTRSRSSSDLHRRTLPDFTEPTSVRPRKPGEWNWDGVWETRVKRAVEASISQPVLYGSTEGDDVVCPTLAFHKTLTDTLERYIFWT